MIDIPYGFAADIDPKLDIDGAVASCGVPVTRQISLQVNDDTLAYWKRVRKKRVAEVILVIPDGAGRYLVHTKAFYPQGVYRLLTGGIKAGEGLLDAVAREAHEETGQALAIANMMGVIWTTFEHQYEQRRFTSYMFALAAPTSPVRSLDAKEQITDYRFATLVELASRADDLETLTPEWADWGRFRAVGHRLAVELLT